MVFDFVSFALGFVVSVLAIISLAYPLGKSISEKDDEIKKARKEIDSRDRLIDQLGKKIKDRDKLIKELVDEFDGSMNYAHSCLATVSGELRSAMQGIDSACSALVKGNADDDQDSDDGVPF